MEPSGRDQSHHSECLFEMECSGWPKNGLELVQAKGPEKSGYLRLPVDLGLVS